ncbi:MAG: GspE/PulE family protein [Planctomycetota bacterium]
MVIHKNTQRAETLKDRRRLGELLVSKGLVNQSSILHALNEQRSHGGRLGEVLVRLKMLSDLEVAGVLAEHLSVERIHLDDDTSIDKNLARLIPEAIAKRFCLIAIGETAGSVLVAMADPLDIIARDTIRLRLKRPIKPVLSTHREIRQAIQVVYHGSDVEEQRLRDLVENEIDADIAYNGKVIENVEGLDEEINSEAAAAKAPVVRFVNLLLSHAVKSRASDIHIEPLEKSMHIRMRIDGMLHDMVPPARNMQAAVITRVKILSGMNIAERRLPQDGRFKIRTTGKNIDIRVSTIPTIYGEKVVMRILDATAVDLDLNKLGFDPELLTEFKTILSQPYGIIVVTGPTGSGKSTTLYSVLNYLKDPRKNITTVEDPVEYRLGGINQIQVKPEIDLDFAMSLRAILRQDPDIILIGEIRDIETVEIAIKASMTGHLVLSTFHTNDAPSAVSRFIYMGVKPYLLSSTLNLVIAQRLVRKICYRCRQQVTIRDEILESLNISPQQAADTVFYEGKGCNTCGNTGYFGRVPIFEFLVVDRDIRSIINAGGDEMQIRAAAREKGYGGLMESGVTRVMQGLTTPEEVLRVTYIEDAKKENSEL